MAGIQRLAFLEGVHILDLDVLELGVFEKSCVFVEFCVDSLGFLTGFCVSQVGV